MTVTRFGGGRLVYEDCGMWRTLVRCIPDSSQSVWAVYAHSTPRAQSSIYYVIGENKSDAIRNFLQVVPGMSVVTTVRITDDDQLERILTDPQRMPVW